VNVATGGKLIKNEFIKELSGAIASKSAITSRCHLAFHDLISADCVSIQI
jgi:hypothetical protein